MPPIDPIYIGRDAIAALLQYCQAHALNRFALIADTNTYAALGERVETALKAQGYDVTSIILTGDEIIADEAYIVHALRYAPLGPCTFLAVGSGTLTDITRFVSHRTGRAFISLPTAPSVDGFTSIGAPLVLRGVKLTVTCQPPIALFADLETLTHAPHRLVAAGYGDMIGKFTALADWEMGSLLWAEPFDRQIADWVKTTVASCIAQTEAVGQQTEEGVKGLLAALVDSGLAMLQFGSTQPASGAEHHVSHFWEMRFLLEGRPAALHGAKVGYALAIIAAQYARLRAVTRPELLDRLEAATFDREAEIAAIRQGHGVLAEDIIQGHRQFLEMTPENFDQLKHRIVDQWDAIQAIAARVPPPEQIITWLKQAGAITEAKDLGLSEQEVQDGLQYGHYLRNRFTVLKLNRILGI
ncbi:MAG TPA: sn-glycerol-1-phosphate dehydrogenase [Phototrophicaceae bacterium]|nr:sn-glycerol-1-phosphate dehydrogenase [Phototrophicaceae bacterium]